MSAPATQAPVSILRADEITRLRLHLADADDRIDQPGVIALGKALREIAGYTGQKAVVLESEGRHFCKGRASGPAPATALPPLALQERMMAPILDVYDALRAIPAPVVAVVRGEAHGFGAALAASADITLAADDARFSFPELLGDMPPTLAMATVLDTVAAKALGWMVYTSAVVDAQTARQAGLVSEVVPAGELQQAQSALLDHLTERSVPALAGVKKFLACASRHDFPRAADYGRQLLAVVLSSRQK